MTRLEQWEWLKEKALDHGITVRVSQDYYMRYRIGGRRYQDQVSATCALLSAFRKANIEVPAEVSARPTDMD